MTDITPSKATDLPSEILKAIFCKVPGDTQIVCQRVCKSWYYPARRLFYKTITVMENKGTNSQLSRLMYTLGNSSVGLMVKLLKIEGDRNPVLTLQELIKLISLCPNIQQLSMCNNATYFRWLLEYNKELALNDLKTLSILGKVSWRSSKNNPYFYEAVGKFANSIEALEIPDSCSMAIEQRYGNIFNYLDQFTKLKELTMINGSQRRLVYFHSLLETCHGLEKLNTGLGHPLFDPSTTSEVINSVKTYPSMHELAMFLPNFSLDYFYYIIRRFVNLRKLNITINQGKECWYKDKKLIRQFMVHEYIPLVKILESSSLAIKINDSSCNSEFFSESMKYLVVGGSNNKIVSQFEIDGGRAERDDISLITTTANKNNKNSSLLYATSHCSSIRDFSFSSAEFPFKGHLEIYGHHINKLEIKLSNTVKRAVDLGLILRLCSNLEVLEIVLAQPTPKEYSWDSLLEICNGMPNLYINHQGQQQQQQKLITLNLHGAMITPSLLNNISKYVPNLQSLNLMNCSYKLSEKEIKEQQDPSRFDMSNLSLKQFTLDTSFFYNTFTQHTCFKFTTTSTGSKKSTKYYILNQQATEGDIDISFKHIVSESAFHHHCATAVDGSYSAMEFIIKTLESMTILIGKYSHQQKIKNISFV